MAVDRHPAGPVAIGQTDQTKLVVSPTPQRNLVVVHPNQRPDLPIRTAISGEKDQPRSLRHTGFHRVRPHTSLKDFPITVT